MKKDYFKLLREKEYDILCYEKMLEDNIHISRCIKIVMAIISTGSLSALFVSGKLQSCWSIICIIVQAFNAALPYLPFEARINELEKGISNFSILFQDMEMLGYRIKEGLIEENNIVDDVRNFEKRWEYISAQTMKGDTIILKNDEMKRVLWDEASNYIEVKFGEKI